MSTIAAGVRHRPQERKDLWWLEPTVIVVVLGTFVLYSIYAGLANANYFFEPYLSPLYSPCLTANCVHPTLPLIGSYWNLSPAILIVAFPLAFRVTCYYYRRSYYRAFFWSPPACAVPDVRKGYAGETRFPFLIQNLTGTRSSSRRRCSSSCGGMSCSRSTSADTSGSGSGPC